MTYRELFLEELKTNDVMWCAECTSHSASHKRGFAVAKTRTVHFDSQIATRKTLMGGLHEIGHVVCGHDGKSRLRRFEKEAEATAWAIEAMRRLGVAVPRAETRAYADYVKRMKHWGNNIAAGRKR